MLTITHRHRQVRALALGLWLALPAPALLAGPAPAPATDFTTAPVELEEAGIYCGTDPVGTEPAPGTESGYILVVARDQQAVSLNRRVPAALGISFGVRIRLAPDAPPGAYRMVVHHPPIGPEGITREVWDPNLGGAFGVRSFLFEHERELQPGPWSFEVERDGTVLMRQSFEVVPAQQAPDALDICFGRAFTS
ncbi:DUF3859 domain-containing protein [Pseudooceanicola sp. CBS1P-1]|uniref:DUF3859 domain-containing protein n=1 Tax=Pseudooceanicola albus TaxID=2692189 RepID=A0A6L7G3D7_9RHOB|nr:MULTISPECIES: DUF3859 domain-containing protein [Pseudooceanicola]MBT9384718.1 DUF3859 domain-containing protein [Pseudooceanicola endophyticus]MXN18419.1 DUF3859 domain-containing protein [Pseudooceanicola albus]